MIHSVIGQEQFLISHFSTRRFIEPRVLNVGLRLLNSAKDKTHNALKSVALINQ